MVDFFRISDLLYTNFLYDYDQMEVSQEGYSSYIYVTDLKDNFFYDLPRGAIGVENINLGTKTYRTDIDGESIAILPNDKRNFEITVNTPTLNLSFDLIGSADFGTGVEHGQTVIVNIHNRSPTFMVPPIVTLDPNSILMSPEMEQYVISQEFGKFDTLGFIYRSGGFSIPGSRGYQLVSVLKGFS